MLIIGKKLSPYALFYLLIPLLCFLRWDITVSSCLLNSVMSLIARWFRGIVEWLRRFLLANSASLAFVFRSSKALYSSSDNAISRRLVRFFIRCPFFKLAVKPQGVKGDLSLLQWHRLSITDTGLCVLALTLDNSTPKAPKWDIKNRSRRRLHFSRRTSWAFKQNKK